MRRLGERCVAFHLTVPAEAPPSVTLLPGRRYAGAPIGVNYHLRVFKGEITHKKYISIVDLVIFPVLRAFALPPTTPHS